MRYGCLQILLYRSQEKITERSTPVPKTRTMPQTNIVSATRKENPSWIAEEGRGHVIRKGIEVRNEKGKGRKVAIMVENENEMKGNEIGNEIGSAKELANKNEKEILRGRSTIVLRRGRETEKEKEKERKNVSAKRRRRKHAKEKRSESAKRKRNANAKGKRKRSESSKRRKHESANATVKKSAIDIANGNGGAIDTMTGSAGNETRNATKKETVQGSAKKRRGKKDFPTYPRTHPKLQTEFEN